MYSLRFSHARECYSRAAGAECIRILFVVGISVPPAHLRSLDFFPTYALARALVHAYVYIYLST